MLWLREKILANQTGFEVSSGKIETEVVFTHLSSIVTAVEGRLTIIVVQAKLNGGRRCN